jgi:hypothetical protein
MVGDIRPTQKESIGDTKGGLERIGRNARVSPEGGEHANGPHPGDAFVRPAAPLTRQPGLEPGTYGLEGRCSIQLSYWRLPN